MTPEEIVTSVFARVRARDIRVADLYAEDATLYSHDGVHRGRDAIRAFYKNVVEVTKPNPQVVGLFVNLPTVAAVINAGTTEHIANAVDVFQVEDGEIRSMRICMVVDVPAVAGA
ncbi:MAG TPA: nuclear transport factor 2 family protein [Candidatus Dormibacteraeota bacterium]|nr:nuclear transport factor 2 family protein [Candidatus Dormibacteraeota bacterium]